MLERAGIRRHAAGRNRAVAQRPEERLVPLFAAVFGLDVGERARDALVGVVHRLVDGRAVLRGQPILLIPDVEGGFLKRNAADVFGLNFDHRIHGYLSRSLIIIEQKLEHKWRWSREKKRLI